MLKTHRRLSGMIILSMLATSSLSATYSFAESNHSQEDPSTEIKLGENCRQSGLRTILTEKIIDGKLEVQQYEFPDIVSKEDLQRTMQLDNHASNWTYVCNAYNSGIVLFDGKASKLVDSFWRNSSEFTDYEFIGWKNPDNSPINGNQTVQGYSYKIIFSGNTEEIQENELFLTLSLELNSEFNNNDKGVTIEGFESNTESINQNNLGEKSHY